MRRLPTSIYCFVLLSVVTSSAAIAQTAPPRVKTYALEPKFERGMRLYYESNEKMKYDCTMKDGPNRSVGVGGKETFNGRADFTILETKEGVITAARVVSATSVGEPPEGKQPKFSSPQTEVVRLDTAVEDDSDFNPISPESLPSVELHDGLRMQGAYTPPQPVRIGQTWKRDQDTLREALGLKKSERCVFTCTLKKVAPHNGRETAHVFARAILFLRPGMGQTIRVESKGMVLIDVESGIVVARDLDIELDARFRNRGKSIKLTGTSKLSEQIRLLPPGAPSVILAAAFEGEFNFGDTKLTLKRAEQGYRGTIVIEGKKFDVDGKIVNGVLHLNVHDDSAKVTATVKANGDRFSIVISTSN